METGMTLGAMAAKLFPLLFNMMGPMGVIPAFAALTGQMDERTRKAVAGRAVLLSFCSLKPARGVAEHASFGRQCESPCRQSPALDSVGAGE